MFLETNIPWIPNHQQLGTRKVGATLYYTCKFPVGQFVYPIVNVGGPRVLGTRTSVQRVNIIHSNGEDGTRRGLSVYYHCANGAVYSNEDELYGDEIDARRACKERNRACCG